MDPKENDDAGTEVQDIVDAGAGDDIAEGTVEEGGSSAASKDSEDPATGTEDEERTIVSFGDEDGDEDDTNVTATWIKDLRQRNRDQTKEINALKKEREQTVQPASALGERPTLEGAEYDADVFETNLTDWLGRKASVDAEQLNAQHWQEEQNKAWESRRGEFDEGRKGFDEAEYMEAEETLRMVLNEDQQAQMVHVAGKNAASIIMGLARRGNDKQMRDLAAIKDPLLFAAAVGRLEAKMTVSRTKPKTTPETRVASNGGGGATSSSHLEVLREKALKDGNYTDVIAYKRQMEARENG